MRVAAPPFASGASRPGGDGRLGSPSSPDALVAARHPRGRARQWGLGAAGSAPARHAGGHRFKSDRFHGEAIPDPDRAPSRGRSSTAGAANRHQMREHFHDLGKYRRETWPRVATATARRAPRARVHKGKPRSTHAGHGPLAHLVERCTRNAEVSGSTPERSTAGAPGTLTPALVLGSQAAR